MRRLLAVHGLLIGLLPAVAAAQAPSPARQSPGRIVGVYDDRTGAPIEGAEVRDLVSGQSALTTQTGTVALSFVDTMGTLLRIRKFGYTPVTMSVANGQGLPPLTITLEPLAQTLPAVTTRDSAPRWRSPGLRGFEERRATGFGHFISDSTLRREENRTLADAIRAHVPSANIIETRDPKNLRRIWLVVSNRSVPQCAVDVYLDGVPYGIAPAIGTLQGAMAAIPNSQTGGRVSSTPRTSGAPPSDLTNINDFQISDLAGVEYHNVGDVPAEYNRTGAGCGVLLLWTKER